jgi:hypothetical protein
MWFTPVWGYVHQLFFFFISFFQSSYMHQATDPTPQRTGDLCAPRQILLPELDQGTKPYTSSVHKALTKHLHLALPQVLTHSCITNHLHLALQVSHTVCTKHSQLFALSNLHRFLHKADQNYFLHHLATYLYITKRGLNMGKPMGRHPIPIT